MLRTMFLLLLSVVLVLGAPPLATVSNSPGLALNGTKLAATGVSSWPLVAGDSLATTASTAMIMFPDQTRVALEKNSRLKLEREGDRILVRLLEGALAYKLTSGSHVQVSALGRMVTPGPAFQGKVSIVGKEVVEAAVPPDTFSSGYRPANASTPPTSPRK